MERGSNQNGASVAWFKLAELITRREREKALSVYRLLAHSLEDRAYALQLEADILYSLNDKGAFEKYRQAALLYQKKNQWVHAAALYENLLTHDPNNMELLSTLLHCYAAADWKEKFDDRLQTLVALCTQHIIDENHILRIIKALLDDVRTAGCDQKNLWIKESILILAEKSSSSLAAKIAALF